MDIFIDCYQCVEEDWMLLWKMKVSDDWRMRKIMLPYYYLRVSLQQWGMISIDYFQSVHLWCSKNGGGVAIFSVVFRPMKKAVCSIQPLLIYGMQYSSFSTWKNRIHHKNMCFEKLTIFSNARLQNPLYISLCLKKLSSRPHPEFQIEFLKSRLCVAFFLVCGIWV